MGLVTFVNLNNGQKRGKRVLKGHSHIYIDDLIAGFLTCKEGKVNLVSILDDIRA